MRAWVLAGTLSGAAFSDADQEACAVAIEGLGHTVTRLATAGITAQPTRDDCDVVVHIDGAAGAATALRATVSNAAPVLTTNSYYVQNFSGALALLSGAGGTDASDDQVQILNLTPGWTDGHAINDIVTIAGGPVYQERLFSAVAGGLAFFRTPAANHNVCWGFPVGTTNLAGGVTTARVAAWGVFTGIRVLNAAGLQILDDLLTWLAVPVTVTAFGPQVLWEGRESVIQGTGFGATQGSGEVTINIAGNRTAVQDIVSWSDTEITFTTVMDDGVNEPIQAFPDEVAMKVENQWGSERVFLGLVVAGPDMHYHGVVQTGIHLAFNEGPKDFSNLPDNVLWTDITSYTRGFNYRRGRQHELGTVQAGTANILLSNNDGAFNEHNTQSPFHPNIRPLIPVRIVAAYIADIDGGANDWEFYRLWSGYVESWPVSFPNQKDSIVSLTCSDLFKALSLARYGGRSWSTLHASGTNGPEAWWRFSGTGADVDESGNGHDLTWLGSPATEQPGVWSVDEAVRLDGVDDRAIAAFESALEIRDDMTIEFWFRPDASGPPEGECIVTVEGTTDLYTIIYDDGSLIFYPTDAGGGGVFLAFEQLTAGQWHHVVVTIEWNSGRTVTCYVDGVLQSTSAFPFEPAAATRTFRIGSADTSSGFFSGDLSEMAIWDRVLTAAEVSEHYDASFEALPVESTEVRVERLLDLFTDPLDAELRVRAVGQTDMQGRSPSGATLGEIQATITTESGLFFMDGEGIPVFEGRHYRLLDEVSPRATFGPADEELPMHSFVPSYDDSNIANLVRVTPGDDEPTAVVIDTDSVDSYGPRVLELTTYPEDRNEALSLAAYLASNRAQPSTRIRSVSFKLGAHQGLWEAVLGADLSYRYRIKKAMVGDDFSQGVYVESIAMNVSSSKEWTATWELSPASTQTFWVLGQEEFSELDESTQLAY
jgi:hypothetical protein